MNGVHDMGGMHGFGPIEYDENKSLFHYKWEGRVHAIPFPVSRPGFRYAVEQLEPALYLASSYYERWLHAKIRLMIETGAFTQAEFDECLAYYRENPQAELPRGEDPKAVIPTTADAPSPNAQLKHVDIQPTFSPGDAVRTRNMHPTGHTRLPRYARSKRGQVVNYYGVQQFDDATSAGRDEAQPLYNVRFEGQELWGESAEPNSAVYLDMWESYLEFV